MVLRRHVCAALAMMMTMIMTTSCSTQGAKEIDASAPPKCEQAKADESVLEKVGRGVFWIEIKLLEQTKQIPPKCDADQQ